MMLSRITRFSISGQKFASGNARLGFPRLGSKFNSDIVKSPRFFSSGDDSFLMSRLLSVFYPPKQVSIKELQTLLLQPDLVDHVVFSDNTSIFPQCHFVAKIYMKDSLRGTSVNHYAYFSDLRPGSLKKLFQAKEALGDHFCYVRLYMEINIFKNAIVPFVVMLYSGGVLIFSIEKMIADGSFDLRELHAMNGDENSQNKVDFEDLAGFDEAKLEEIMEFVPKNNDEG